MPTFMVKLPPGVNNAMLALYNDYKRRKDIDDCWEVTEEDCTNIELPILLKDCPMFESADHNIDTIDAISSFCVIESSSHCVWFDRCKGNAYWSIPKQFLQNEEYEYYCPDSGDDRYNVFEDMGENACE